MPKPPSRYKRFRYWNKDAITQASNAELSTLNLTADTALASLTSSDSKITEEAAEVNKAKEVYEKTKAATSGQSRLQPSIKKITEDTGTIPGYKF